MLVSKTMGGGWRISDNSYNNGYSFSNAAENYAKQGKLRNQSDGSK